MSGELQQSVFDVMSSQSDFFLIDSWRTDRITRPRPPSSHDEIVKTVHSGDVCAVVLLGLSMAFDTVDHQILLQILNKRLAVESVALDW